MKNRILFSSFVLILFFTACHKNKTTPTPVTELTQVDLIADSTYLFSKEVYLWNSLIPSYSTFNPRQYDVTGDLLATSTKVMDNIKKLQANDRFSMVLTKAESDGIQTGQDLDYGYFVKAAYINSNDIKWFVTYVYNQSSAGLAGVKRGWYINKIGSDSIIYNQASIDKLNNLFFGTGTSSTVEFVKPDGSKQTLSLTKTVFQANSVLYSNIFTNTNGKKIGYLVFNSFFGQPSRTELGVVFNNFQSAGINELIVDLRNNLGGSTDTQDTLANLIAPLAANSKTMYQYEFNQQLQQGSYPLLSKKFGWAQDASFSLAANTVRFSKKGALNLSRVFFITTYNSASASELLINNLKPVMDVQIIGDTTRGKPVGFFPIVLFNQVAIYPISFRTINGAGSADYYNGFAPNKLANDGVNKDWGDVTEPCLAQALNYINVGGYIATIPSNTLIRSVYQGVGTLSTALDNKKFTGMYYEHK